ncbi:DUF3344 domain-containing protein [Methanosarcina horonobensis]|uniref:DUF3344 domain-containing protein n=1 Tax=Methanosarcina horonobensis TaxID=418008 RepID=UPI000AA1791F|nr:DUF3344 domain-containing protein [Methanosarcina horonobensis]
MKLGPTPEFNGQRLEKFQLAGANDENEDVYCAGHGVYWVSYDVSKLTKNGENNVEILTSSGEPGNKLDGRVYGAVLAAACEDSKAPMVSYQLLSGNVNFMEKAGVVLWQMLTIEQTSISAADRL